MKTYIIIALVVGGLPLAIYPFVLLADVMSLAATKTGKDPVLLTFVARAFLWSSLAYPVVYVPCALITVGFLKKTREEAALAVGVVPVIYLALVVGLFFAWMIVQKRS